MTVGEIFECCTNEHHRRAHEEVSDNISGEDWNRFKAGGHIEAQKQSRILQSCLFHGIRPSCALNEILQKQ